MNLSDLLDGRLLIEFVGGATVETTIIRVIWNVGGEPIALIDDNLNMYNWSTTTRVRRVK